MFQECQNNFTQMTNLESEILLDILFINMKILNTTGQSKLEHKCCSINTSIKKKWPKNKNKIKKKSGIGFFIQSLKKLKNMVVSGNLYKIARIKNDQLPKKCILCIFISTPWSKNYFI
ncbi:hypothetical protein ABPG72_001553 [Tetrahymena utriculariae]